MIDALIGSITAFDAIVFAVVIMSALMAFSRGFMRELATLAALFFASIAAFCGRIFFRDTIESFLPAGTATYIADIIIIALAFLIVYILVRVLGGKFTALIQGSEGVNMLDRLAGFVFGIARGLVLPILAAWLFIIVVPAEAVPEFISQSATYPYFERIASALNANAPEFGTQADTLFETNNASRSNEL